MPVSSRTSRRAACSKLSPNSIWPPGAAYTLRRATRGDAPTTRARAASPERPFLLVVFVPPSSFLRLFRFSPVDHPFVEPLVLRDHNLGVELFDRPRAAPGAHPPPVFVRQNFDGAVGHRPRISDLDQVARF